MERIHLSERAVVPLEQFSSHVSVAIPGTLSHLIACVIYNAMHDCRIEPKDHDLWMLELFVEAERVGETRPLRILPNHVHKPSMFFASLKNTLVVLAQPQVRRMPCHL